MTYQKRKQDEIEHPFLMEKTMVGLWSTFRLGYSRDICAVSLMRIRRPHQKLVKKQDWSPE